jgi:hypothetical protein
MSCIAPPASALCLCGPKKAQVKQTGRPSQATAIHAVSTQREEGRHDRKLMPRDATWNSGLDTDGRHAPGL